MTDDYHLVKNILFTLTNVSNKTYNKLNKLLHTTIKQSNIFVYCIKRIIKLYYTRDPYKNIIFNFKINVFIIEFKKFSRNLYDH